MATQTQTKKLNEKAMMVTLNIGKWTARKYDKKISKEVEEKYSAVEAGRYNKLLIKKEEVSKMINIAQRARKTHYFYSLPWYDSGPRIISAEMVDTYCEKMRAIKGEWDQVVHEFLRRYEDHVEEARKRLNGMFDETQYPSVQKLRNKYRFSVHFESIPEKKDFRVQLADDEFKAAMEALTGDEDRTDRATQKLWERMHKVVKKMFDKVSDDESTFRDSLVENIKDMVDLLPKLNVIGNTDFDKMVKEIDKKLANINPERLREDSEFRASKAKEAKAILDKMAGYGNFGDDDEEKDDE